MRRIYLWITTHSKKIWRKDKKFFKNREFGKATVLNKSSKIF